MTTVRELAEELGVSPQTIRRFVREELHVATQERKTVQLDAAQASIVADHFKKKTAAKRNMKEQGDECRQQELLQRVASYEVEIATLRERVAGLERENSLLRMQLESSNKALEREQMNSVGFWKRLGQHLLGSGSGK